MTRVLECMDSGRMERVKLRSWRTGIDHTRLRRRLGTEFDALMIQVLYCGDAGSTRRSTECSESEDVLTRMLSWYRGRKI